MRWKVVTSGEAWWEERGRYEIAYRRRPDRAFGVFASSFTPAGGDRAPVGEDGTLREAKERCERHLSDRWFQRPMGVADHPLSRED